MPLSFLAVIFTVTLTVFLQSSFNSLKLLKDSTNSYSTWTETSLAAAKRVSTQSNSVLLKIQTDLNSCLEDFSSKETESAQNSYQCNVDFKKTISDYKYSLKHGFENQLNKTIKYGLNASGKVYESYSFELFHSDYIPSALEEGKDKFNVSLITPQQRKKKCNAYNFMQDYLRSDKLVVSYDLLQKLVGEKNAKLIKQRQAQFKLELDYGHDGFAEENLANAIKLVIKHPSIKESKGAKKERALIETVLNSTGQLRLEQAHVNPVVVNPPVCNECSCDPSLCTTPPNNGGGNNGGQPTTRVEQQHITFGTFDHISGRGILYDHSQAFSAANPVRVVNANKDGYTNIFPDQAGFLNIQIGRLNGAYSPALNNQPGIDDINNVSFAKVTLESAKVPDGHIKDITNSSELRVDIIPRGRKIYMTAQKDFTTKNGQFIPKGTILVGTIAAGSNYNNVRLSDLAGIRAYSPNTGANIAIFKPEDRPNTCGQDCFSISQFRANSITSFSTRDIIPNKTAFAANAIFINIQKDLEVHSNTGFYNAKFDWQKDVLRDDLNKEQQILYTQELKEKYGSLNTEPDQARFLRDTGFGYQRTGIASNDSLQVLVEKSFVNFAKEKNKLFGGYSDQDEVKKFKNGFISLRNIYLDFLRANISKDQADNRIRSLNLAKLGLSFTGFPDDKPEIPEFTLEQPIRPEEPTLVKPGKFTMQKPQPFAQAKPKAPGMAKPTPPSVPVAPNCTKKKKEPCASKWAKYRNQNNNYPKKVNQYNKDLATYNQKWSNYYAALNDWNSKKAKREQKFADYRAAKAEHEARQATYQEAWKDYDKALEAFKKANKHYNNELAKYEAKYGNIT